MGEVAITKILQLRCAIREMRRCNFQFGSKSCNAQWAKKVLKAAASYRTFVLSDGSGIPKIGFLGTPRISRNIEQGFILHFFANFLAYLMTFQSGACKKI